MDTEYLKIAFNKGYFKHSIGFILTRAIEVKLANKIKMEEPILDLCCGEGFFSSIMFNTRCISSGVDISDYNVKVASKTGIYKSLVVADARRLPYLDNSFTTIICNSSLEHILDINAVLSEVNRIIKENGNFIFSVPLNTWGENFFLCNIFKNLGLNNLSKLYRKIVNKWFVHHNCLSVEDWRISLQDHDFNISNLIFYFNEKTEFLFSLLELIGIGKVTLGNIIRFIFPNKAMVTPFLFKLFKKYYENEKGNCGSQIFVYCEKAEI